MRRLRGAIGLASSWLALGLLAAPATAAAPATWITLGTMGGPIAYAHRSQPANVLLTDEGAILVDTGDGAAEQLAKAGVPLPRVCSAATPGKKWLASGIVWPWVTYSILGRINGGSVITSFSRKIDRFVKRRAIGAGL